MKIVIEINETVLSPDYLERAYKIFAEHGFKKQDYSVVSKKELLVRENSYISFTPLFRPLIIEGEIKESELQEMLFILKTHTLLNWKNLKILNEEL